MNYVPFWSQWLALVTILLFMGIWLIRRARLQRGSFRTDSDADFNLALPPLIFVTLPALALLIHGLFLDLSGLILVGLVSVVLVAMLSWWPYQKTVCRFAQRLVHLDRFIRLAYFGFPALMVLLGGFAVGIERASGEIDRELIDSGKVGGLLLVALAFQVFAYVSNDVIDLPIDRQQPKRQDDPLVRGDVSLFAGIAVALVQFPAALLVTFLLLGASWSAYAVLVGAFVLMTVYNFSGKRCEIPPVTDAVQALAWASLALFGALVIDPKCESDNWILVWTVCAFGAGFILLISGIHGGLRDLENDEQRGCKTTARFLCARVTKDGVVLSNWKIQVFAFIIHTLMFVLPFWAAVMELELTDSERWTVGGILVVCFVGSSYLLYRVVRKHEPERDLWTSAHAIIMLQAPLLAFTILFVGPTLMCLLFVCFYGPLLSTRRSVKGILNFTHGNQIACEAVKPPP
jgi:4-hydroxybenzoate polyprenyltransferase